MKNHVAHSSKFKRFILHPIVNFAVEMIFIFASFSLATNKFYVWDIYPQNIWIKIIFYLWIAAVILKISIFVCSRVTYRSFQKMEMAEKLSSAMLNVQQRANAYKTRHVLQITYGSVPQWHPFDFYDNVLVYDVHEQIRTILLELKNAIISVTPDLDNDAITVDLVYCYPEEGGYGGQLPIDKNSANQWKLISTRDASSMNYRVQDFLASQESFYFYLNQNNYVFFNDKSQKKRYYIPSGKDHEYGLDGSIVGLSLNVKNDMPEKVLLKAMITITTYGRKLNEKGDPVKEKDYKELFKKNVLNGYKTLLESELSQMYIRHMIREGGMCPRSGAIMRHTENKKKEEAADSSEHIICPCKLSQAVCKLKEQPCGEENK